MNLETSMQPATPIPVTQDLTVLCCACKAHMRGPPITPGLPVSHGVCKACLPGELKRAEEAGRRARLRAATGNMWPVKT